MKKQRKCWTLVVLMTPTGTCVFWPSDVVVVDVQKSLRILILLRLIFIATVAKLLVAMVNLLVLGSSSDVPSKLFSSLAMVAKKNLLCPGLQIHLQSHSHCHGYVPTAQNH